MMCICIKCGSRKRGHLHKCQACAFKPTTSQDIAKALYLSRGVLTEEQKEESPEFVPQDYSEEHLLQIGGQLAAGVPYEYNELRLGKLLAQGEAVGSVNGKALL